MHFNSLLFKGVLPFLPHLGESKVWQWLKKRRNCFEYAECLEDVIELLSMWRDFWEMRLYNMFEQQIPVAGKNYLLIYHLAECRRESNEQRELKTGTTMHINFTTTSKKRSAGQYSVTTSVVLDVVLAGNETSSGTHLHAQRQESGIRLFCRECQVTKFVQLRRLAACF